MWKKSKNRKTALYGLLAFLAVLFLRFIVYAAPVACRLRTDDFGTLAYPAYLAGYDWSSYISGWHLYYGFGYYWIFAPLFALIQSPNMLLLAIVLINAFLLSLCAVLIYRMLTGYLDFAPGLSAVLVTIICAMFQGEAKTSALIWYHTDNEVPLFFICWIMVWLLLRAHRLAGDPRASGQRRFLNAAAAALVLCWGLSVHERVQALLLAVVLTELILFLLKRRWLFMPLPFFAFLAAGFAGQRLLRKAVIGVLWAGNPPVHNMSVLSNISLSGLFSGAGIKAMLLVLFGNLHAFLTCGFGLPALAAAVTFLCFWRYLPFRKKKTRILPAGGVLSDWAEPSFVVMMTFGICVMIIIAGLTLRWGTDLYPGILAGKPVRAYKGICYNRYYYVFIGPVLFGLFGFLKKRREFGAYCMGAGWGVLCILETAYLTFVHPFLVRADAKNGSSYVKRGAGTIVLKHLGGETSVCLSILIMLAVFFAVSRYLKEPAAVRPPRALTLALLMMAGIFALDRAAFFDPAGPSLTFQRVGNLQEVLQEITEEEALPEHVYLERTKWGFAIQLINRSSVFYGGGPSKDKLGEDNLVIRKLENDTNREHYTDAGYDRFEADEYYAVYTNDPETAAALRAAGVAGEAG